MKRVTIIGLGLIGGSLGMAIRRRHLAEEVIGVSHTPSTLAQAKRRGAIDRSASSIEAGVRDADLVVLAAPVDALVPLGKQAAAAMRPGSVLTDVGSTKAAVVRDLERIMPKDVSFVGAHPLAGSEQRGIAAARPDLFDGSTCIVTPTHRTDPQALKTVRGLWRRVAQRVVTMDPLRHDQCVAAVSHVPHLLAFCLVQATSPTMLPLAPRSFLEATRVAKSDSDLWDDILLSNRQAILASMQQFDRAWQQVQRLLRGRNRRALQHFLRDAARARTRLG